MKLLITLLMFLVTTSCTSVKNNSEEKIEHDNNDKISDYKSAFPISDDAVIGRDEKKETVERIEKKEIDESPCRFIPGYVSASGEYIRSSFECSENSIYAIDEMNDCSWIPTYKRPNGTSYGYYRCNYNFSPLKNNNKNSTLSDAPCVGSYCGPVQVKGYYRKDGTYVRPHTRSR